MNPWETPAEAPVLVLGSGQRCGSTLVQRLLTSHDGVMIWGEHGGHLKDLLAMHQVLMLWDEHVAEEGRRAYGEGGHDSWMANVLPGRQPLLDAARAYLLTLFHAPAATQGRPRWGFKEVRFGFAEAAALRELFPGLVVVHLTRDPRDVLISLDVWERELDGWPREYTELAVAHWTDVTRSFLEAGEQPWVLSRRYEEVIARPARFTEEVARLLQTDPGRFDASVFGRKIHGATNHERKLQRYSKLPKDLRALLDAPPVREVARAAGYR